MPATTLAQFRSRVYNRIENNSLFYTSGEVDGKINEALKVTNLFACWNQGRMPAGLTTANRVFYRTPAGMIFPMKVYLDDRELEKDSVSSISGTQSKWIQGLGNTARCWMPIGLNMYAIFPSDKHGARALEIWGVMEPDNLINDTDTSNLADEMSDLVVEYAFFSLVLKEGARPFVDASKLYKPWLAKLRTLQAWEATISPAYQAEIKQAA